MNKTFPFETKQHVSYSYMGHYVKEGKEKKKKNKNDII